jgi:nicotinate-nucleotide adenylyltransferase
VAVVAWILSRERFHEVLVVPCLAHPFGKVLAPFRDRLAMCRVAFKSFGRRVRVSGMETGLPGPSYTVETLRRLKAERPEREMALIVGSDVIEETDRWRDFDEVQRLAPLLVLRRPGHAGGAGPLFPDVSSSAIREALGRGEDVSGMVPAGVLEMIARRRLYGIP